ncbi:MAG: LPS-assembly protein LptD, partial [Rickettsiales bacterium]
WNIAPNKDAVITPIYTSDEGPVLAGEYRHLLRNGYYELEGSITYPDRINENTGIRSGGNEFRGHIEGNGRFQLTDIWYWGFDGKHTSDDTYLRRYDFGHEDLLTSKAYVRAEKGRSYLNAEVVGFQGLRADDDSTIIPFIHPLIDASHETDAGWHGSRFGVEGNVMALSREIGPESRRLSTAAYWRLPHITQGGHVFEMRAQMRADMYSVTDEPINANPADNYTGTVGRVVPELWMDWRYPLLKRFKSSSLIIEPTVNAVVGINGVDSEKIPNEDSLALEFSDSNLFSSNHYPGYDLVESGTRVSYGIRGQMHYDGGSHLHFLFGQNYHTDDKNLFPYSNDLSEELSDYVGRVAWNYSDNMELAYRFRLDRQNFELKRSEVDSRFHFEPVRLRLNYVRMEEDPYLENNEEIRASSAVQLTDNWIWTLNGRRDLSSEDGGMIR